MRVSLFITCYNDTLFPETGKSVVRVLERLGHEVEFRAQQGCCGQMHWNTGYFREALPIIRNFVQTFGDAELICIPSSSCVAMIRDHYEKAAEMLDDPKLSSRVREIIPRVYEFTELLVKRFGIRDVGAEFRRTVTYHASCHSIRTLKLGTIPIDLLKHVRGLELVDLKRAEECCGFGGTFAIKNADVSAAMLADKTCHIQNTTAEVCTAVDNSCLMHIYGGLHRQRTYVQTAHIAEILASREDAKHE